MEVGSLVRSLGKALTDHLFVNCSVFSIHHLVSGGLYVVFDRRKAF